VEKKKFAFGQRAKDSKDPEKDLRLKKMIKKAKKTE